MDLLDIPRNAFQVQMRLLRLPLTAYETFTRSDQPLADDLAGKFKEVAGTVLGNRDMTDEGKLQQVKADQRREAEAREVIAKKERQEAQQEFAQRQKAAEQEKARVARDTAQREAELERERAAAKARVDRQIDQREDAVERQADAKKAAVAKKQTKAAQQRAVKVGVAAAQEQAAERAKADAETLEAIRKSQ